MRGQMVEKLRPMRLPQVTIPAGSSVTIKASLTIEPEAFASGNTTVVNCVEIQGENIPPVYAESEETIVYMPPMLRYVLNSEDTWGTWDRADYDLADREGYVTVTDVQPIAWNAAFLGWSTEWNPTEPDTAYNPGNVLTLTENLYLRAVWEEIPVRTEYVVRWMGVDVQKAKDKQIEWTTELSRSASFETEAEALQQSFDGEVPQYYTAEYSTQPKDTCVWAGEWSDAGWSEDTSQDGVVLKIRTYNAVYKPMLPARDDLHGILGYFVKVIDTTDKHGFKTYSTHTNDTNGYESSVYDLRQVDGEWVCTVMLNNQKYADFYGWEPAYGTGRPHDLTGESAEKPYESFSFTLYYRNNQWQSASGVKGEILHTVYVTCASPDEVTVTWMDGKSGDLIKRAQVDRGAVVPEEVYPSPSIISS